MTKLNLFTEERADLVSQQEEIDIQIEQLKLQQQKNNQCLIEISEREEKAAYYIQMLRGITSKPAEIDIICEKLRDFPPSTIEISEPMPQENNIEITHQITESVTVESAGLGWEKITDRNIIEEIENNNTIDSEYDNFNIYLLKGEEENKVCIISTESELEAYQRELDHSELGSFTSPESTLLCMADWIWEAKAMHYIYLLNISNTEEEASHLAQTFDSEWKKMEVGQIEDIEENDEPSFQHEGFNVYLSRKHEDSLLTNIYIIDIESEEPVGYQRISTIEERAELPDTKSFLDSLKRIAIDYINNLLNLTIPEADIGESQPLEDVDSLAAAPSLKS